MFWVVFDGSLHVVRTDGAYAYEGDRFYWRNVYRLRMRRTGGISRASGI